MNEVRRELTTSVVNVAFIINEGSGADASGGEGNSGGREK